MVEVKAAQISSDDEEARLRERLRAKKFKDDEEARLRERLKAKKSKHQSDSGKKDDGNGAAGDSSDKKTRDGRNGNSNGNSLDKNPKNKSDRDVSPRNNGNHLHQRGGRDRHHSSQPRRSGSRDRRSNSHGRRGRASSRDRRGPRGPPGFGNGPPPPHGWNGPPRGGPFFEQDPYGRAVRPGQRGGFAGRQPPPFRGHGGFPPGGGGGSGPPRGPPPPGFHQQDPHGQDLSRAGRHGPRHYHHHHHRASRSRSRSMSEESYASRESRSVSSRSTSRSRSPLSDDGGRRKRSRSNSSRRGERKHARRSGSSHRGKRHGRQRSPSTGSSEEDSEDSFSSSGSSSDDDSDRDEGANNKDDDAAADAFTKDQRTVFVNQLVMRTKAKDIRRYFRKKVGCKINDVILLRDKRTGQHKGCAYVEMRTMDDVAKALQVSGQPPDFQRFPLVVKPSEAEKNYLIPASTATLTSAMVLGPAASAKGPIVGTNGKPIESQQVYVGNLSTCVTQEHLFALFSQLGQLERVSVQMDPATGTSKGYAFLSFRDPKESNLAIQTMSNQMLVGRPMKTGWASQTTSATPGVEVVTSEEIPVDASARVQKAYLVLAQLAIGAGVAGSVTMPGVSIAPVTPVMASAGGTSRVPTVAEARANLASAASGMMGMGLPATSPGGPITPTTTVGSPDAKIIKGAENPTRHLLVHNMFDKDKETEEGWAEDIRVEFQEECGQYGSLTRVVVMSKEPGGKIYASFEAVDGAKTCASALAGRWFDKRQLRVEYVQNDEIPTAASPQVSGGITAVKTDDTEGSKEGAADEHGVAADEAKPAETAEVPGATAKEEPTA